MPAMGSQEEPKFKPDPPPTPEERAKRRARFETCGACRCCKRWRGKLKFLLEKKDRETRRARSYAAHLREKYEALARMKIPAAPGQGEPCSP